jgi:hypothetical protein
MGKRPEHEFSKWSYANGHEFEVKNIYRFTLAAVSQIQTKVRRCLFFPRWTKINDDHAVHCVRKLIPRVTEWAGTILLKKPANVNEVFKITFTCPATWLSGIYPKEGVVFCFCLFAGAFFRQCWGLFELRALVVQPYPQPTLPFCLFVFAFYNFISLSIFPALAYDPPTCSLPSSWAHRCILQYPACWMRWVLTNFLPRLALNFNPPQSPPSR